MASRPFLALSLLLLIAASNLPSHGDAPAEPSSRPVFKSPLGLAVDGEGARAYVALHTPGALAVVDLRAGKVLAEIPVGRKPHDVALTGKSLFVTCEQDDALVRIDTDKQIVTGRWKIGQSPRGVAATPDGKRVFVACHDEKSLAAFEVATQASVFLPIPGWPERISLHRNLPDRAIDVLARQAGSARVVTVTADSPPRVVNVESWAEVSNPGAFLDTWPRTDTTGLLVHQEPRAKVPATQVAQAWIFTNAISLQIGGARGDRATRYLDDPRQGHADPSDLAILPGSDLRAAVACAGSDDVLFLHIPRPTLRSYLAAAATRKDYEPGNDSANLSATRTLVRSRLTTQANPRRLALSANGKLLVASNHLADSLTVIDAERLKVLRHIPLVGPKPDAARRGEILFHSGRMTFQGQFTCASCHPGGGSDGLNWDLPRDGVGNFVNTRSLLGVKDTAPYGWHGSSKSLADRVAGTLRTLHRHEPHGTEVEDIVAYLKTLEPPRPLPLTDKDKQAATRGKLIFEGKGKCVQCHRPPVFDDAAGHDVGTRVEGDVKSLFDTPSLRGVARTAPYLHHGQAETLEEVLTKYNPQHRHGAAHELTPAELADLVAYLKSL